MSSGVRLGNSGSFVSNGAAKSVKVPGFKPRYVKVVNGASGASLEWFDGMPDDSALKTPADGNVAMTSSAGITPLDDGFTLGADAAVNNSGDVVYYRCEE